MKKLVKSFYHSSIFFPVVIFLSWRLLILLFQIFLQPLKYINNISAPLDQRLFVGWVVRWDGGHYIGIAENGYKFPQQAFFPVWPLLIRYTSKLFWGQTYYIAYILVFLLGLAAFILFYSLAKKLIGKNQAKVALLIFAAFPTTMYLHTSYTEALFLTLALLSFYLLETRHFLLAALTGGLITGTKAVGMAIPLVFVFIKDRLSRKIIYLFLSCTGLFTYMLYLFLQYQDPLYFKKAEETWCLNSHCTWSFPLKLVIDYANLVSIGWIQPSLSSSFIDWIASVLFLVLSIEVYKTFGVKYLIYTLAVLLPRLTSGTMLAMVRYVLVAFPVFFLLPRLINSKILLIITIILLLLLQLRFVGIFINGDWVA